MSVNYPDQDFLELVAAFRALLADYEHIGMVKTDVYYNAVEALAKADRLLATLKAGANIEDNWKNLESGAER